MAKDFLTLAKEAKLQEEAIAYVYPVAQALDGTMELEVIWQKVLAFEDALGYIFSIAPQFNCEGYALALAACVLLTRNMHDLYVQAGTSEEIYKDSLADIPIWALCCKKDTGKWGMKQFQWLENTLRAKLWRLGRFEFELVEFEEEYYEKDGRILRKGDTVINVHIPEGSPMTDEVRADAYKRAMAFFGRREFVCESWLLWPAHDEILPETSNIRHFMHDFTLLRSWPCEGVADLWRIFGYLPDYDAHKLPRNTMLQRAYADKLLETGGISGGGYGVMLL